MAQIQITGNGSKGYHQFVLTVAEISTSAESNTSIVHAELKLKYITLGRMWSASGSDKTVSYTISIGAHQLKGTISSYDGKSTVLVDSGSWVIPHNADGTKTISCSFNVTDTTALPNSCGDASGRDVLELSTIERPITGGAPVIEASVIDTNSTTINLTGSISRLIKYHSTAKATMTATAQGGAAIDNDMYIIRNGSETESGTTTGYFANVESDTFTFSAQDSVGRIGTATVTADMVDYVKLTCNMGNSRPDTNGEMALTCSGNYFNGSFGAYSNTLSVGYSYTGSDGSFGSGNMEVSESGNTYFAYAWLSGLNYLVTYSFEITASDRLETVESTESGVKSKPVFHWGENDFVFEVPVTFNSGFTNNGSSSGGGGDTVDGNLNVTGDLRLKGDGLYGNFLYFGDGSNAYIAETAHIANDTLNENDDYLTIYARRGINLKTDGYHDVLINGRPIGSSGSSGGGSSCDCEYGTWTPRFTNENALDEYITNSGWYQKVGNVVTIGWYLEASVYKGYTTTELKIVGCPFGATHHSFGGGIMYGPYIAAGLAFEGWGLNGNTISARLQPCNNTSAGDLNISQNVYFPKNTSPVKLSGTICFMTNS